MARTTYVPLDDDEILDIDPETETPNLTRRGPNNDNWMVVAVGLTFAVIAALVVLGVGIGFSDLAFGTTG
jgi:hypothetical protein